MSMDAEANLCTQPRLYHTPLSSACSLRSSISHESHPTSTRPTSPYHPAPRSGVRICRTIGTGHLRNLDPFLMLDELKMPAHEASAGFPDHPHRGFETCSIMLSGKMEHRDSYGNHGVIGPGGVQWMTAGRGIVHSEMPKVTEGMLHG